MKNISVFIANYYTKEHMLAMDILFKGFKEIELINKEDTDKGKRYSLKVTKTGLKVIESLENADCFSFTVM